MAKISPCQNYPRQNCPLANSPPPPCSLLPPSLIFAATDADTLGLVELKNIIMTSVRKGKKGLVKKRNKIVGKLGF